MGSDSTIKVRVCNKDAVTHKVSCVTLCDVNVTMVSVNVTMVSVNVTMSVSQWCQAKQCQYNKLYNVCVTMVSNHAMSV